MEILKPVTQGPPLAAAIELALRRAVQVTRIDPGAQTRRAGNETRQHPGQDRAAAEARDVAALRREMERRALPPGPICNAPSPATRQGVRRPAPRKPWCRTTRSPKPRSKPRSMPTPRRRCSPAPCARNDPRPRAELLGRAANSRFPLAPLRPITGKTRKAPGVRPREHKASRKA